MLCSLCSRVVKRGKLTAPVTDNYSFCHFKWTVIQILLFFFSFISQAHRMGGQTELACPLPMAVCDLVLIADFLPACSPVPPQLPPIPEERLSQSPAAEHNISWQCFCSLVTHCILYMMVQDYLSPQILLVLQDGFYAISGYFHPLSSKREYKVQLDSPIHFVLEKAAVLSFMKTARNLALLHYIPLATLSVFRTYIYHRHHRISMVLYFSIKRS